MPSCNYLVLAWNYRWSRQADLVAIMSLSTQHSWLVTPNTPTLPYPLLYQSTESCHDRFTTVHLKHVYIEKLFQKHTHKHLKCCLTRELTGFGTELVRSFSVCLCVWEVSCTHTLEGTLKSEHTQVTSPHKAAIKREAFVLLEVYINSAQTFNDWPFHGTSAYPGCIRNAT